MVDALGNLLGLVVLPGQRRASVGAAPLIEGIEIDAPPGDTAFANDWRRAALVRRGARAVVPPKAGRARRICGDFAISERRL